MKKALCTALALLFTFYAAQVAVANPVELWVDGARLTPETPAFVDAHHRTQVPVRAVTEALGGRATWLPGALILVEKDGRRIEMTIGSPDYVLDGKQLRMDTVPVILSGRTFVPVRFLGEALQCRVEWDGRRVLIRQSPQAAPPATYFELGTPSSRVLQAWGQPLRLDPGKHGFEWWIYHNDWQDYRQLGIRDGRVVTFYTASPAAGIYGIPIGAARADLEKQLGGFAPAFSFEHAGARFTVEQSEEQLLKSPLLLAGNTVVQFFFDTLREDRLTAFRTMDLDTFLAVKPGTFTLSWRWTGREPRFQPPPLSEAEMILADRAEEHQIFDLANALRQREGLPLFQWDERVAGVAREHSRDMLAGDYFSHISPAYGDPGDRLSRGGISWRAYAENIAYGPDAVTVHEAWLNSPGHRENLFSKAFSHLGAGVADRYYTQNFVRY